MKRLKFITPLLVLSMIFSISCASEEVSVEEEAEPVKEEVVGKELTEELVESKEELVVEELEAEETIEEELVEEEPMEYPEPIPEPNVYESAGDDIIDIEKPEDELLAIMYVRGNEASRHFAINGYDAAGERTYLFVNTTDPYEGIVQLNVDSRRGDTTRLEVSGTGSWYIEIRSLRSARAASAPGKIIGEGDEVFLVEGELDTAFIVGNDAGRHFAIKGYNSRGNLLVNTTDPYEGRVMVPSDISVIEVTGFGEWEINFE